MMKVYEVTIIKYLRNSRQQELRWWTDIERVLDIYVFLDIHSVDSP